MDLLAEVMPDCHPWKVHPRQEGGLVHEGDRTVLQLTQETEAGLTTPTNVTTPPAVEQANGCGITKDGGRPQPDQRSYSLKTDSPSGKERAEQQQPALTNKEGKEVKQTKTKTQ